MFVYRNVVEEFKRFQLKRGKPFARSPLETSSNNLNERSCFLIQSRGNIRGKLNSCTFTLTGLQKLGH